MIEALAAAEPAEEDPSDGGGGGPDGGGLHDQVATLAATAWLRLLRNLCDNLRRLLARVKVSTQSSWLPDGKDDVVCGAREVGDCFFSSFNIFIVVSSHANVTFQMLSMLITAVSYAIHTSSA